MVVDHDALGHADADVVEEELVLADDELGRHREQIGPPPSPNYEAAFRAIAKDTNQLLAAAERDLPVFTPGWEDSTTGNMFAAAVYRGALPSHRCVSTGTEQMVELMRWYQRVCRPAPGAPSWR